LKQSKVESAVEATLNTLSGFLLSLIAWVFIVAPFFGLPFDWGTSLGITVFFTFMSIGRNYLIRRFFVGGFHTMAVDLVRRLYARR